MKEKTRLHIKIMTLTLSLLITTMTMLAQVKVNGIYYNLHEATKQATVTAGKTQYKGNIIIPDSITFQTIRYKVSAIDEKAFNECFDLQSIVIPSSVYFIGKYAFNECFNLKSITIPNTITEISEGAFSLCI